MRRRTRTRRRGNLSPAQRKTLDEVYRMEAVERMMRVGASVLMAGPDPTAEERIEAMAFFSQANQMAKDAEGMRANVWNPPRKKGKKKA